MTTSGTDQEFSDRSNLTKKNQIAHDFLMFLYSNVVGLLKQLKERGTCRFRVDTSYFSKRELEQFSQSKDPISFLREKGMDDELKASVNIGVAPALISEFCSTWYEVMSLTKRGKTSIALQLLRKQIEDVLFHLEWMVADPDNYAIQYNSGIPKNLQRGTAFKEPKSQIAIINKAIAEVETRMQIISVMSGETHHLLRYDKSTNGYYKTNQQAVHLITALHKDIATDPYELNFIFSDENSISSQQNFIYETLPYICDHFRNLALLLLDRIDNIDKEHQTWFLDAARRQAGLKLILPRNSKYKTLSGKLVISLLGAYGRKCPRCENSLSTKGAMKDSSLRMFMYDGNIQCDKCDFIYFAYSATNI